MVQATLQSQTPDSLYNSSEAMWAKIIGGVISMISLILQDHEDLYLVDRVTIVRGYAELSLMYPNNVGYRQRVSASLLNLSETLADRDNSMLATQVKLLSDRCRKFDKSVFRTDDSLTVREYTGDAARREHRFDHPTSRRSQLFFEGFHNARRTSSFIGRGK
jgi:hypothetical protein